MSERKFSVSHLKAGAFKAGGLRAFFEYRDLGVKDATGGRAVAHVIRARPGGEFVARTHWHETEFQLVYVLKGWIKFDYEGVGEVLLEAGSCAHQPPGIRHRELGHSGDLELLEVVLPGEFKTVELPDH
jgi:quercetin dioxygenase-like cupin family protein